MWMKSLFMGVLLLSGLACREASAAPEHRALVKAGALLLDVRTVDEFSEGHLPGAINIPLHLLQGRLKEVGDRNRPVVVYCAAGSRSMVAARVLKEAGYTKVHDLGGMSNW